MAEAALSKEKYTISNAAPKPKVGIHKNAPKKITVANIETAPRIIPVKKLAKDRTVGFPSQMTLSKFLTPQADCFKIFKAQQMQNPTQLRVTMQNHEAQVLPF